MCHRIHSCVERPFMDHAVMKSYFVPFILSSILLLSACDSKTEPTPQPQPQTQPPVEEKADTAPQAPEVKPDTTVDAAGTPIDTPDPIPEKQAKPVDDGPNPAVLPDTAKPVPTGESVTCEEAEGCDCGETKCPMNAVCTDGVCKCGDTLVESGYTGYACWEIAKGVYDLGCTESQGCPCGKITVYSNMGCSGSFATCAGAPVPGRGLSCRHKPYKNKYYSLGCFKDTCDCYGQEIQKDEICAPLECKDGFKATPQGCSCDGRKYEEGYICVPGKDQRLINYCTDPDGCPCGEEKTCARGTVCRNGNCVDRYTLHDILPGFEIVRGLPTCKDEENCLCSRKKIKAKLCKLDQVCLNDRCYNNPNFRKFGDIAYYYIFDTKEDATYDRIWNLMFVDANLPICSLFSQIKEAGSDHNICDDEATKENTVADLMTHCGTASIPDDVKILFCTLSMDQTALVFSGWHK